MYVTTAELVVVAAALVTFAFAPAALALVTQRRPRPASGTQPVADPTAQTTSAIAPAAAESASPPAPQAETGDATAAGVPADEPPQALSEPRPWPTAAGPKRTFQLGELRSAGPFDDAGSPGLDRSPATMRAVQATMPDWSGRILEAPVAASAYSVAGVERAGNRARIVVLLFEELWPPNAAAAVARALFEFNNDGSVGAAVVEPACD